MVSPEKGKFSLFKIRSAAKSCRRFTGQQPDATHSGLISSIEPVNAELAKTLGLDKPTGALVGGVERGGPADKAGLQAGDVVLQFNGEPIRDANQLPQLVGEQEPGSTARLQVWHHGQERSLTVKLGTLKPAAG